MINMCETNGNFIENIINADIEKRNIDTKKIQFRHPPEPSGYLHIGHVRNILLNYGLAQKYGGKCNLRYDDTNPTKENQEFVDAIQQDVLWLGFHWDKIFYASEYFQKNYEIAVKLIKEGKAYVDDLSPEEVTAYRGTLNVPGKDSPYRNRSIEENLLLFERMKNGEFAQGKCTLRAKIDMSHPNMTMRDPIIYRIQYESHQRIGRKWNIYPTYDFSHPLDDAIEGVSYSICGPEFENHRPLYNWVVQNSGLKNQPRQIEYANLNIEGVILGKRNINRLVNEGKVWGYDDPRLFTLRGLKRRGVLPQSIIDFVKAAGVSKCNVSQDIEMFNYFVRNTLNEVAIRVMAVINPVKLVINNMPNDYDANIKIASYPQLDNSNQFHFHRFSNEILVEREDFQIDKEKGFYRLYVGNRVRLKGACVVKCVGYKLDSNGEVESIIAEYDNSEAKVKATIHWINPKDAYPAEMRCFRNVDIDSNDKSMRVYSNIYVEKNVKYNCEDRYQFIRNCYCCLDQDSENANKLIFNSIIDLKDSKKRVNTKK